jgi:hypothetical protein
VKGGWNKLNIERPLNIGDVRNMEHLPRKTISNEWSQPRRNAI